MSDRKQDFLFQEWVQSAYKQKLCIGSLDTVDTYSSSRSHEPRKTTKLHISSVWGTASPSRVNLRRPWGIKNPGPFHLAMVELKLVQPLADPYRLKTLEQYHKIFICWEGVKMYSWVPSVYLMKLDDIIQWFYVGIKEEK